MTNDNSFLNFIDKAKINQMLTHIKTQIAMLLGQNVYAKKQPKQDIIAVNVASSVLQKERDSQIEYLYLILNSLEHICSLEITTRIEPMPFPDCMIGYKKICLYENKVFIIDFKEGLIDMMKPNHLKIERGVNEFY